MAQHRIKRIDPIQSGKVYAVIIATLFVIILIPFSLIFGAIGFDKLGLEELGALGSLMPVLILFIAGIFYIILGFIMGVLSAFIYNFTYRFHKGVVYEIED